MADAPRRLPRHPIANRYPASPPARIEINVHRRPTETDDMYMYDTDGLICNCYPRPSDVKIPSMFYDQIKCPHHHRTHIQPAQENQFNYPWTADSVGRMRARGMPDDDDSQAEGLSLISEEDEELRFTPAFLRQKLNPDILSITSGPPFRYRREMTPRINPPFTAPNPKINFDLNKKKSLSMTDLRDRTYRVDGDERNRYNRRDYSPNRYGTKYGPSRDSRQFTGNYVDPKNGKVYQYNVNYGKQNIDAVRRPVPGQRATPASAL